MAFHRTGGGLPAARPRATNGLFPRLGHRVGGLRALWPADGDVQVDRWATKTNSRPARSGASRTSSTR